MPTDKPARAGKNAPAVNDAAAQVAAISTGGINFSVTFHGTTYVIQVYPRDANGQSGFTITEGATVVAGLIYKDDTDWEIKVGLPATFKIDDNLTINALNVDIQAGTVQPLT